MQEIIGKSLGPYEVVSQLGTGGMANVYKAYQPSMDRHVALKVLSGKYEARETLLKRFLQEAHVVAKLEHPHILPVHDFGETDGYFYIVMRLVETGTLHDRFRGRPFPLEDIRKIITQVADALDYAHSENVVHRDIKLKNILIDQRDNCLLTDFGIAKVLSSDARITQTGKTLGTPTFMSPEQIRGEELDGRSDIYALGVVLYQLATGRPPYDADIPQDILLQHLQEPLSAPRNHNPDVPAALERVIIKTLAKNREDRYATANEMAVALQAALLDNTTTLTDEEDDTTALLAPIEVAKPPASDEDSEAIIRLPDKETIESSPDRRGRNRKVLGIIGAIIGLLLVGGVIFSIVMGLPRLLGPPPPVALPPPSISGQWHLRLEDSFDDNWLQLEELGQDGILMGYENGRYVITVEAADDYAISLLDESYGDFMLEVEATQLRGSFESTYGITLRDQGHSYYSFEVSQDGAVSYHKTAEEDETILFGREIDGIRNDGPNTLRIEAVGPRFTLFINDKNVGEVINRDLGPGDIGLLVTTFDTSGGTSVAFDNLKVWTVENEGK